MEALDAPDVGRLAHDLHGGEVRPILGIIGLLARNHIGGDARADLFPVGRRRQDDLLAEVVARGGADLPAQRLARAVAHEAVGPRRVADALQHLGGLPGVVRVAHRIPLLDGLVDRLIGRDEAVGNLALPGHEGVDHRLPVERG